MTAAIATPRPKTFFLPREHGATAMLLLPFFSAAILASQWRWAELATLLAAFSIFAAKDPLIVLARQRWIWRLRRPESDPAKTWVIGEALILAGCVSMLARSWPLGMLAAAGAGTIGFLALAVAVNVKNLQRSTLFQIVSAVALSATSLAACLSATGAIQPWCWQLWALNSLQSTAGILVVHARLEARAAARKNLTSDATYRRPALIACLVLWCAAVAAAFTGERWIAAALSLACIGYVFDLHRQKDAIALQIPLKSVGLQALTLSIAYAMMVIAGLR